MNLAQAKKLHYHQTIYEKGAFNSDGTPRRWRVSGKVQTWKKDKTRIRVPLKHGMYNNGELTQKNLSDFVTKEPSNRSKKYKRSKKVSSGTQMILNFFKLNDIK